MIIYKPKTVKRRKIGMRRLITDLKKIRKKYKCKYDVLRDNKGVRIYYAWMYGPHDIKVLKSFLKNGDLTSPSKIHEHTGLLYSSYASDRVWNLFKSRRAS